jgi:hypothetical protein
MAGQLWGDVSFIGLMPDEGGLQFDIEHIADNAKFGLDRNNHLAHLLIIGRNRRAGRLFELTA